MLCAFTFVFVFVLTTLLDSVRDFHGTTTIQLIYILQCLYTRVIDHMKMMTGNNDEYSNNNKTVAVVAVVAVIIISVDIKKATSRTGIINGHSQ